MRKQITIAFVLGLLFLDTGNADSPFEETIRSPDGQKLLTSRYVPGGIAPEVDITITENGKELFRTVVPPAKEAHYTKASWDPTSSSVLVAINYKCSEDWIFIHLKAGKGFPTYFDGDDLVDAKLLDVLPFRHSINVAPVARVPWKTVQWHGLDKCTMLYIFRGIGYEGTAHLLIQGGDKPTLAVTSIVPAVDKTLWDQY